MGLDDEAKRLAGGQNSAELAARQARAAESRRLAQIHPWRISVNRELGSALREFRSGARQHVSALKCMLFKGVPRPSHDMSYSKGEPAGFGGWCIFPTSDTGNDPEISISVLGPLFVVTTRAELVLTRGLVERGTYTNTGFLGPKVVISLPTVAGHNRFHGKVLGPNTPIEGGHVHHYPEIGAGPMAHTPHSSYTPRPLRDLLIFNLAAMRRHKHPQQTGEWKRFG